QDPGGRALALRLGHRAGGDRRSGHHRPNRKQPLRPVSGPNWILSPPKTYYEGGSWRGGGGGGGAAPRRAGPAPAPRRGPPSLCVFVVATVLFAGPNARRTADAVQALAQVRGLRVGLWTAWILATAPAVRLLVGTPSTFYLRSLPRARAAMLAALGIGF